MGAKLHSHFACNASSARLATLLLNSHYFSYAEIDLIYRSINNIELV
jgi:hypothetical protein